jgi:DMSO/TMAO reductase YedYZ molybdopterin-dependent catalytic subunit
MTSALCLALLLAVQPPSAENLVVIGEASDRVEVTVTDLRAMSRRTVTATAHGATHTYEGVLLADVLKRAGARFGELLRGPRLATYLLVEARDGYRVVFALPELDAAFTDREIILADTEDGKSLTADDGPLRVVVPGEKRGARWVRQVSTLRVLTVPR